MAHNRQVTVSRASALIARAALGIVILGSLCAVSRRAAAEEPWQLVARADREGVTLDRRAVPGSKFYEYRARAVVAAPPEVVFTAIWTGVSAKFPTTVKQRTMISSSATELVFYDQIQTKVVSDRDFTLRMVVEREPGVIQVPFTTRNELGPPPIPGYVRVPMIRGNWIITVEPPIPGAPSAGPYTKITYLCYSDPGGSIPAFMARGAQQDQVMIDIHRILLRAQHPAPTTAAR